jgi:hypothetical protein
MNLELTIIIAAITFIVMLIILANLHTKMRTIVILLNTLVKKLTMIEEKIKWDNEYIKSKLTKEEKKNDNITWTK